SPTAARAGPSASTPRRSVGIRYAGVTRSPGAIGASRNRARHPPSAIDSVISSSGLGCGPLGAQSRAARGRRPAGWRGGTGAGGGGPGHRHPHDREQDEREPGEPEDRQLVGAEHPAADEEPGGGADDRPAAPRAADRAEPHPIVDPGLTRRRGERERERE